MTKETASVIFKALGDPNRLKIVKLLINNDEICACELLHVVNCKQATLSHHLAVLASSGLLKSRRDGKNIIYSCDKELLGKVVLFLSESCDECKRIDNNEVE